MKKAFSLFELILVVAILGLVFSFTQLSFRKDRLFEGALQILNDLRYTRTLALMQGSFRTSDFAVASDAWYKSRWQLYFINSKASNNQQSYTIFLDKNGDGNANIGKLNFNKDREFARDLLNAEKFMSYGQSGVLDFQRETDRVLMSERFNIERKFGIARVEFKGSCSGATRIVFDEFGRLYKPLKNANSIHDRVLSPNELCVIRLKDKYDKSLCIAINSTNGYAFIPPFGNSHSQNIALNGKIRTCDEF